MTVRTQWMMAVLVYREPPRISGPVLKSTPSTLAAAVKWIEATNLS